MKSDSPTTPAYRTTYNKPLWLAGCWAVCAHAALLPIEFKTPDAPQQPSTSIDIRLITQATGGTVVQPEKPQTKPEPSQTPLPDTSTPKPITSADSEQRVVVARVPEPEPLEAEADTTDSPVTASSLSASSLRMASLKAVRGNDFLPKAEVAPESIRRKYITANTKEMKYSMYQRAWTDKVERVGNLNYPEIVRREHLSGDLIISVGINHDGSLESIEILRHSGFPQLDEAAIRIVEMSAPYAALPAEIAEEIDILHITRTWRFTPEHGLIN